jgi:hypothetical protein
MVEIETYQIRTAFTSLNELEELSKRMPPELKEDVDQALENLCSLRKEVGNFGIWINDFDGSITNRWQRFDNEYASFYDADALIDWLEENAAE